SWPSPTKAPVGQALKQRVQAPQWRSRPRPRGRSGGSSRSISTTARKNQDPLPGWIVQQLRPA
ncbi:MAG: hypothetical protein ACK559_33780, partial [bacterium]